MVARRWRGQVLNFRLGIAVRSRKQRLRTIHLHVDNADEVIERAAAAGATVEVRPKDELYGERSGCIRDPFGQRWSIGHQIERVPPEEMRRRYTELLQKT
jgi:hypothetical protein